LYTVYTAIIVAHKFSIKMWLRLLRARPPPNLCSAPQISTVGRQLEVLRLWLMKLCN